MENSAGTNTSVILGMGLLLLLFVLAVLLAFYVFYSYCFQQICKKTGHEPGGLIWIPIVRSSRCCRWPACLDGF